MNDFLLFLKLTCFCYALMALVSFFLFFDNEFYGRLIRKYMHNIFSKKKNSSTNNLDNSTRKVLPFQQNYLLNYNKIKFTIKIEKEMFAECLTIPKISSNVIQYMIWEWICPALDDMRKYLVLRILITYFRRIYIKHIK